jgi:hypothetical protein
MSSPEPPLVADKQNYNPGLEPAPAAVPPEQQVSSSHMTLDDPPPLVAHFLGFRLRPVAEIANASRSSLVEEIVQQAAKDADDECDTGC